MSAGEEPLSGGNVGSVVRVGDTVRRATGPWMHAVHELLRHLEDVGFEWSPRVHGVDEHGARFGLVAQRVEASITGMESQAAAGEPAFQRMVAAGHSERMRDDRAFLAANASAWRAAIGL